MRKTLLSVLLTVLLCSAQTKRAIHFSIEDGLASNLTKCITQDSTGYIWIASDGGLIRYDGHRFEVFRNGFPSFFIKDVKPFGHSKLIVLTDVDAGIFEINGSEYRYLSLLNYCGHEKDLTFNYPKSIFISSDSTVWVTDLSAIYSMRGGRLKKYQFDETYAADSYFHSFTLFEDNWKNLYAFSYTGALFSYDALNDRFTSVSFQKPQSDFSVETVVSVGANSFMLGSVSGVYRFSIDRQGKVSGPYLTFKIPDVSSIIYDQSGKIFIGTYTTGLYEVTNLREAKAAPNPDVQLISVKFLYRDKQNNIWAASDEGIAILDDDSFVKIRPTGTLAPTHNLFVSSIDTTSDGRVYFTNEQGIFAVTLDRKSLTYSVKTLVNSGKRLMYNSVLGKSRMWISYRDQSLECRDIESQKLLYRFYEPNNRLNQMVIDNNNNLWAYSEKKRLIFRISPDFRISTFPLDAAVVSITVIRQLSDGAVYAAGIGHGAYLFRFDPAKNSFTNISNKVNPEFFPPFGINDFVLDGHGEIHCATNLGYYKGTPASLKKVEMAGHINEDILKAIAIHEGIVFLGSDKGVIEYFGTEAEAALFDRQEGLPNSSIVEGGLVVDRDGFLWAGTVNGAVFGKRALISPAPSPAPVISAIVIRGKKDQPVSSIQRGGSIEFKFTALCFPANKTIYAYRLLGFDSNWVTIPNNSAFFQKLPVGDYVFQVRAHCTGYRESNITSYAFEVTPPWYLSGLMVVIYSIAGLILLLITVHGIYMLRIKKLRKNEEELNEIVKLRTDDLRAAKERAEALLKDSENAKKALEESNDLKSQILSIAAHDLKNPLNVIMAYSSELVEISPNDEVTFLSKTLNDISVKMFSIINDLLESVAAKSKTATLNRLDVDPAEIVGAALPVNAKRAVQKQQKLITEVRPGYLIHVDAELVAHAVDNLLSNAVKYSPPGGEINVFSEVIDGRYQIKVKDEGPGFTENDKKQMFGIFQRLSAKPTANEASSGLGLSIVKDVVEKNDGRVWVESEYKKGALFIMEFPLVIK